MIQFFGVMLLILIMIYMIVRYVSMKSLNIDRKGVLYLPWFVLYLLVI